MSEEQAVSEGSNFLAEAVGISGRLPATAEEADKVEELLADELEKLSLVEREQILFDVHGFAQVYDEDPPSIQAHLKQFESELFKIRDKPAYEHAKYLNTEYVSDPAFRIMFLRSENFDPKKAAKKMISHFQIKRELFGSGDVLGREVRLSDLTEDDVESLESGFIQVLPTRDAAGRSIFCLAPMYFKHKTIENLTRSMWYVFSSSLRDEETQKKGVVIVLYNVGKMAKAEELSFLSRVHRIRLGIPKRVVGIHYCFDDSLLRPFVAGLQLYMSMQDNGVRARFRPHFGNHVDIQFELQTYGIPTKDHPIKENGSLCLAWHHEWLHIRKTQETSSSASDGIIVPRRFDVLFGRGKNTSDHTGNLRAGHLVEMYREKYEQASKYHKTEISERIVSIIHESHGRFLKWDGGNGWVQVEHDLAREKISHFFRHMRSKTTRAESPTQKRVTPCTSPIPSIEVSEEKESKQSRSS